MYILDAMNHKNKVMSSLEYKYHIMILYMAYNYNTLKRQLFGPVIFRIELHFPENCCAEKQMYGYITVHYTVNSGNFAMIFMYFILC